MKVHILCNNCKKLYKIHKIGKKIVNWPSFALTVVNFPTKACFYKLKTEPQHFYKHGPYKKKKCILN